MTYENLKSIILSFLVVGSVLLTWNLWTYQPNYETMENASYVEEVSIASKKEIKTIIKPGRVLFHYQGSHFGTEITGEIDKIIREMSKWNIHNVKNYTNKIEDFKNIVHGEGTVEIIFPEKVPLELYKTVLTFENKSVPNFSFDRIIINMDNLQKEIGTLYFVSYDNNEIYSSNVSGSSIVDFKRIFFKDSNRYPRYFTYEFKRDQVLFLPEAQTSMVKYKYYPDYLDSEKFKEALFADPSFVQKSLIPEGEEYTDGSSKMNVFYKENLLFYVNPMEESDFEGKSFEILQRGIDFINEHGGWTDPYRFVHMDEWNQQITFRLYSADGYPIFNENGMSEIIEVWGRNEITKYLRPNFSLDLPLRTEMLEVLTPSGWQIIDFLQKQKEFNMDLLEELSLGYSMEKDPKESRLIVLEPAWFYRYNGKWGQVRLDYLGGERNGLE
jgi:regulatory protein YycH of two-component signal transduction system YycFG